MQKAKGRLSVLRGNKGCLGLFLQKMFKLEAFGFVLVVLMALKRLVAMRCPE